MNNTYEGKIIYSLVNDQSTDNCVLSVRGIVNGKEKQVEINGENYEEMKTLVDKLVKSGVDENQLAELIEDVK